MGESKAPMYSIIIMWYIVKNAYSILHYVDYVNASKWQVMHIRTLGLKQISRISVWNPLSGCGSEIFQDSS